MEKTSQAKINRRNQATMYIKKGDIVYIHKYELDIIKIVEDMKNKKCSRETKKYVHYNKKLRFLLHYDKIYEMNHFDYRSYLETFLSTPTWLLTNWYVYKRSKKMIPVNEAFEETIESSENKLKLNSKINERRQELRIRQKYWRIKKRPPICLNKQVSENKMMDACPIKTRLAVQERVQNNKLKKLEVMLRFVKNPCYLVIYKEKYYQIDLDKVTVNRINYSRYGPINGTSPLFLRVQDMKIKGYTILAEELLFFCQVNLNQLITSINNGLGLSIPIQYPEYSSVNS